MKIGLKIKLKCVKFAMFFKVPTINTPANTKVKILSIQEGIIIQKTIRDRNSGFRIILYK